MAQRFPCIESTVEATFGDLTIRLWIDEKEVPMFGRQEIYEDLCLFMQGVVPAIMDRDDGDIFPQVIDFLARSVDNINAAHVKWGPNLGVIVYFVPFAENTFFERSSAAPQSTGSYSGMNMITRREGRIG